MRISDLFGRRAALILGAFIVVSVTGFVFAFEPVTRNLVASDPVCSYCHAEREYAFEARRPFSTSHPVTPATGEEESQCVDCHLPKGFLATAFTYTHYASATDLFGHFRDRASERAGDWIPPSAARVARVRDRLFEYDSVTCRTCHIEADIKPKRKRGQRAHAKALENRETCIECHDNLVHRYVEVRDDAFQKADAAAE